MTKAVGFDFGGCCFSTPSSSSSSCLRCRQEKKEKKSRKPHQRKERKRRTDTPGLDIKGDEGGAGGCQLTFCASLQKSFRKVLSLQKVRETDRIVYSFVMQLFLLIGKGSFLLDEGGVLYLVENFALFASCL